MILLFQKSQSSEPEGIFFGQMVGVFENFDVFFHEFFVNKKTKFFFQKSSPGSLDNIFLYISPINLNEIGQVVPEKSWLPFSKCSFRMKAFKVTKFSLRGVSQNTLMEKLTCTLQF